ncbi:hypothetical protein [Curtobacterium sp. MCPF17_021]|uniref:hypothetical protein n=1 Tax=Curtobacterium sp. MCPF17_021 TaxID=2175639 RepID=UPI0011B3D94D|nr:hypothetical protein [Curtobacterium sp. MCPF17_021]WIE85141.1 hypothetical protein DEJ29_018115 [Curtobacterium sp. MCPF17_021]
MTKSPRDTLWSPLGNLAEAVRPGQRALHDEIKDLRDQLDDDDIPAAVLAARARSYAERARCEGWIKEAVRNAASMLD